MAVFYFPSELFGGCPRASVGEKFEKGAGGGVEVPAAARFANEIALHVAHTGEEFFDGLIRFEINDDVRSRH